MIPKFLFKKCKFMVKFLVLSILSVSYLFCEDFITKNEYAKMLYENPRGISCAKCHKNDGSGKFIASYKDIKKKKIDGKIGFVELEKKLIAPPINRLLFDEFKKGVMKSKGVMPSYFLTTDEIKILYYYVNKMQKKDKK